MGLGGDGLKTGTGWEGRGLGEGVGLGEGDRFGKGDGLKKGEVFGGGG